MPSVLQTYAIGVAYIISVDYRNIIEDESTVIGLSELSSSETFDSRHKDKVIGYAVVFSTDTFADDEGTVIGVSFASQSVFETVVGVAEIDAETDETLHIILEETIGGSSTINEVLLLKDYYDPTPWELLFSIPFPSPYNGRSFVYAGTKWVYDTDTVPNGWRNHNATVAGKTVIRGQNLRIHDYIDGNPFFDNDLQPYPGISSDPVIGRAWIQSSDRIATRLRNVVEGDAVIASEDFGDRHISSTMNSSASSVLDLDMNSALYTSDLAGSTSTSAWLYDFSISPETGYVIASHANQVNGKAEILAGGGDSPYPDGAAFFYSLQETIAGTTRFGVESAGVLNDKGGLDYTDPAFHIRRLDAVVGKAKVRQEELKLILNAPLFSTEDAEMRYSISADEVYYSPPGTLVGYSSGTANVYDTNNILSDPNYGNMFGVNYAISAQVHGDSEMTGYAGTTSTRYHESSSDLFTVCTSSTRPTSPGLGDSIYETDTELFYMWDGSNWLINSPDGRYYDPNAEWGSGGLPTGPTGPVGGRYR